MEKPLQVFCCYAREDQPFLLLLKKHLKSLERRGLITLQDDTCISPGEMWEKKISYHLNTAQIILLLISSDFMHSEYCYGIEMKRALERHEQGGVYVIPIILRPTDWQVTPLDKLQALPRDAEPVTSEIWHTQDHAFFDVEKGIQKVVEELLLQSPTEIPTVEQTGTPLEKTLDASIASNDITKKSQHAGENSVQTFRKEYAHQVPKDAVGNLQSSPLFQETALVQYISGHGNDLLPIQARSGKVESSIQSITSQKNGSVGILPKLTTMAWMRPGKRRRQSWLLITLSVFIVSTLITGSLVFAQRANHSSTGDVGASAQTSTPSGGKSSKAVIGKASPTVPLKHIPTQGSTANSRLNPTANPLPDATAGLSLTATPGSKSTSVPPTLTVNPSSILVTNSSNYCNIDTHGGGATSMTCDIVLSNTSQTRSALNWSASMMPSDYTISPVSGSIAPGKSATISFYNYSSVPCPSNETLFIKGSANTVQIPIVCTYLFISPTTNTLDSSNCTHSGDWTCVVTISATGDAINVPWQVTAGNSAGVTFSQASGTLAPRGVVQMTITIASTSCPGSNTFTIAGGSLFNPANYLDWNC